MNLTNTARVDAQFELETLSMEMGIARYRAALADGGNGEVSAGQQLIKAAVRPMEEAVTEWLEETTKGLASRNAGVFHFINQLEPVALAWLTAHAAVNVLHERPPLARCAVMLALNLEAAINLEALAAANPSLAAKMAKRVSTITEGKNRLVFIRKGAAMVDLKVIQWDDSTRVRVGTLLLTMFAQSTELVAIETESRGQGKTWTVLRPTESCRKWLEVSHARCELLSPVRMPMVCRPRAWTSPFNGGYLSKGLRQPVVKTRNRGYLSQLKEWDMPMVYATINALQDTEWAVNEGVYQVMKELWEAGRSDGGLPPRDDMPLPARTWETGETPAEEQLHVWKVDGLKVFNPGLERFRQVEEADAVTDGETAGRAAAQRANLDELPLDLHPAPDMGLEARGHHAVRVDDQQSAVDGLGAAGRGRPPTAWRQASVHQGHAQDPANPSEGNHRDAVLVLRQQPLGGCPDPGRPHHRGPGDRRPRERAARAAAWGPPGGHRGVPGHEERGDTHRAPTGGLAAHPGGSQGHPWWPLQRPQPEPAGEPVVPDEDRAGAPR